MRTTRAGYPYMRLVALAAVIAATSVLAAPAAHAGSGGGRFTTTTARVDAGDDPCVLLSAAEVEAAVGVVDPDGRGASGGVAATNQCIYGEALGFHFRITNYASGDRGKFVKVLCGPAKAGNPGFVDYAPLRGFGKVACTYTMLSDPTLVFFAPYRGSKSSGRVLSLAVSGTAEQLASIETRIDPGLLTLAQTAADAVER